MARETVEDSRVLDVLEFARKGYLREGSSGISRWLRGNETTGSISWQVATNALYLSYTETGPGGDRTEYCYPIALQRTPAPIGGERLWFTCPWCGGRVRKLYLPPSGGHFLCRGCHGLSYESRQVRIPAFFRAWARLHELEEELKTLPLPSRRWRRVYAQTERLYDALGELDLTIDPFASFPEAPRPKRGPGRPSKRELRERAQAHRAAAQATTDKRPRGRPKTKRPYIRRKPLVLSQRKSDMEGYCVKCRDRRQLEDPQPVTLSNGRPALRGTCPVCGTTVTRIVSLNQREQFKETASLPQPRLSSGRTKAAMRQAASLDKAGRQCE